MRECFWCTKVSLNFKFYGKVKGLKYQEINKIMSE